MTKTVYSEQNFLKIPIIGIIRNLTMEEVTEILPVFVSAGFTTVEITMNTPDADQIIRYASRKYAGVLNVGAGTVCEIKELELALAAGAQFIVMPIINEEVIKACVQLKIPVIPGAYTANEIYKAWSLGAAMVKVFPATSAGPQYIKDIRGPFDQIKLIPVGGIDIDNCINFMKAGATGLGIGSQLFDKKIIGQKNWGELLNHFELFANKMNQYKDKLNLQ